MTVNARKVGRSDVTVTSLGVGGAPFAGNFTHVDASDATGVIDAAFAAGVTYVDTAPFYGFGRSERAVGDAVRGRPYVLSTKVGRLLVPGAHPDPMRDGMIDPLPFHPVYDYSYDGVMRSFDASLHRLGLDRVDILFVHDIGEMQHGGPDNARHFRDLADGGYRALDELRRSGLVGAIGIGVNEVAVCLASMEIGDWDTFLLAGRYTLLEQTPLDDLLPACAAKGISLIIGGPFNSGILAGRDTWNYAKAPASVIERVGAIRDICGDHGVDLPVAALQFPLGHPSVASVIPGARNRAEFEQILIWASTDTPQGLWTDLVSAGLLRSDAPLPDGRAVL